MSKIVKELSTYIKTALDTVLCLLILFIFTFWPHPRKSLKKAAKLEISELKKKNSIYNNFRYGWTYRITDFVDKYQIPFISIFILAPLIFTLWAEYAPRELNLPYFGLIYLNCPPEFTLNKSDNNFHSMTATIQATVLALIIPITVALHEFVVKGRKMREEMINFIFKEVRVRLVTISSLVYLIWIAVIDLFENTFHYLLPNIILAFWLSLNLILIAYFMLTALKLINRSSFDSALRRFIVNEIYPREMAGYLERNIFLNLSKIEKDDDEED